MSRLTQRTENGASLILDNPKNDYEAQQQVTEKFKQALNKLAEYEDKEEQGLLLDLPCKVGSTIYISSLDDWGDIETYKITDFVFHDGKLFFVVNDEDKYNHPVSCIGKTVFLTREEAEQARKERESNA